MQDTPERSGSQPSRRQRRAAAQAQRRARARNPAAISTGAALALGLGLSASKAHANTYTVTTLTDSGAGSLRQAIEDANLNPGADMISFASGLSGTITLTNQLALTDSVNIEGPGADQLTVSGNQTTRVFDIEGQSLEQEFTISGLKVTGGAVTGSEVGGGIKIYVQNLLLDHVEVVDNIADGAGGGIYIERGQLTIRNSVVSGNQASNGGGLAVEGLSTPMVITDSTFADNKATKGGGLYFHAPAEPVTISRTLISGNTSMGDGGGIFFYYGENDPAHFQDSTIANNTAGGDGGGAFFYAPPDEVIFTNCTISGNHAANGGGIKLSSHSNYSIELQHTTVTKNTASGAGGGLDIAVYHAAVTHSIIAGNSAVTSGADVSGEVRIDHTLLYTTESSVVDNGNNLIAVDPQLGDLRNNGGPTPTHMPAVTSPVIDAGDPAFDKVTFPFDQRGEPQPRAFLTTDLGSVERAPGIFKFAASDIGVDEDAGTVQITVRRTSGSDGPVDVAYHTVDGTASSASGGDFTATSGTLSWADGDTTSKSFTIPIRDDYALESNETLTIELSNATGRALIDEGALATVTIADDDTNDAAPTASSIGDQMIAQDSATDALAFSVGDTDDTPASLTVSATSSNSGLVPNVNVVISGSGANRTVTVTPLAGQFGVTTITLTISDGPKQVIKTFIVTIAQSPAPTISAIGTQIFYVPDGAQELPFTIGDPTDPPESLVVSAVSSNQTLLPNNHIELGGTGANRTIKVTPLSDRSGSAIITITVSDGQHQTTRSFRVSFVRDGEKGDPGDKSILSRLTKLDPGDECAAGGVRIELGVDDNGDATLQDEEVDQSEVVCNGDSGGQGKDGYSAVFDVVPLASGDKDCPDGGVTVRIGLDDGGGDNARNGKLDGDEIDTERKVCLSPADVVIGGGSAAGSCSAAPPGTGSSRGLWALGLGVVALLRRRRSSRRSSP